MLWVVDCFALGIGARLADDGPVRLFPLARVALPDQVQTEMEKWFH